MLSPIPFIVSGKNDTFVVKEEALALLNGIVQNQVGVISIAGLYRTGKSFILNQLAQKQTGFDIGSSVEPCTEGLWMWIINPETLAKYNLPSNLTIVLLDTEGLGSYTKSQTYDARVFSLALLLSSFFLYNSIGTIDDNAIDNLSLVLHLSENIKASVNKDGLNDSPLSSFFPKFMWLLRDFSLDLRMEGKQITPNQYLENSLKPFARRDDPEAASKDAVRECIKKYFPDRSCFTLKRPVTDEEQLQDLATLPLNQFRKEYLDEVDKLITFIYSHLTPKTLYGVGLNVLAQLAVSYVDAMNSGGVPNIQSAWENVVEFQCRAAVTTASKNYEKGIKDAFLAKPVLEEDELKELASRLETKANEEFYQRAVGEDIHKYQVELQMFIAATLEKATRDNLANSKELCEKILNEGIAAITTKTADGTLSTLDALLDALKSMQRTYAAGAAGPAKMTVFFAADIGSRIIDCARQLSDKMLEAVEEKARKMMEAEREKTAKEYETLQDLYRSVDAELRKEEEKAKAMREENKQLKFEMANLNKQIKTLTGDVRQLKEVTVDLDQKNKTLTEQLAEANKRAGGSRAAGVGGSSGMQDELEKKDAEINDLKQKLEKKNKKRCTIM